ncbi:MAG: alpha/beta hydrolase [Anaerolineales bacterium]|nr:alpha/beta hydrolase [Anaerolineales bacterium]
MMPFLNVDEIDLYYEIHGSGEPLLFIHGLGSSSRDWELQLDYFAKKFKVILIDVRGHGRSGKPPGPYSIPLFAEDTAKLIQALQIAPAHILGISLGGMIAFELGIGYPELVKSLIIVNSTPELVARTLKDWLGIWQRLLIVRFTGMRKMGEVLGNRFLPGPELAELREIFIERWAENDKPAYLEAMKAVMGWSITDRLGEIRCPTLVLAADGDYFPTTDKENYVKQIPGAKLLVIENSRHALPAEKPAEFNLAVMEFLIRFTD